jgi:hypothetical protein
MGIRLIIFFHVNFFIVVFSKDVRSVVALTLIVFAAPCVTLRVRMVLILEV